MNDELSLIRGNFQNNFSLVLNLEDRTNQSQKGCVFGYNLTEGYLVWVEVTD